MRSENQNIEYKEIWKDEYLTEKHTSEPANPDIAKAFFRAGYIEIWGRGVSNIIRYCKDAGLPAPYYRDMGPGLAVIFETEKGNSNFGEIGEDSSIETTQETSGTTQETSGTTQETSGTTQETLGTTQETLGTTQKILMLITENSKISRKEIAEKIGNITEDGIKYHLDRFKKKGILKHIGPTKGGYWEIVDKSQQN